MIKKPEGPFDISINDYQRKLLIEVLTNISPEHRKRLLQQLPDPKGLSDNAYEEADMLLGMLTSLPEQNEEAGDGETPWPHTRVTHCFYL